MDPPVVVWSRVEEEKREDDVRAIPRRDQRRTDATTLLLFALALYGLFETRVWLHRLLNHLAYSLDAKLVENVEACATAWIVFVVVLDAITVVAGCLRRRTLCFSFSLTYASFYAALAIAIISGIFCLVSFVVRESCSTPSAVLFVASQLDKHTLIDAKFCSDGADDDSVETDDDAVFADDDGCLTTLDDFCDPYQSGMLRVALRLLLGTSLVAFVQLNLTILAAMRRFPTTIASPSRNIRPRPTEPGSLRTRQQQEQLNRPLLMVDQQQPQTASYAYPAVAVPATRTRTAEPC